MATNPQIGTNLLWGRVFLGYSCPEKSLEQGQIVSSNAPIAPTSQAPLMIRLAKFPISIFYAILIYVNTDKSLLFNRLLGQSQFSFHFCLFMMSPEELYLVKSNSGPLCRIEPSASQDFCQGQSQTHTHQVTLQGRGHRFNFDGVLRVLQCSLHPAQIL